MFTGIVSAVGRVSALEWRRGGARLTVAPPAGWGSLARGESVAVSGVCLTALSSGRSLVADLSSETVDRSSLGSLSAGGRVNLERALVHGDRLSGHFVLGHVDGRSTLLEVARGGNSWRYRFTVPRGLSRFIVEKGSVALDGVSLTVAGRRRGDFDVAVIPETRRNTTFGGREPGDLLNFEVDVFARYGAAGWRRALRASDPAARRAR
ncbi:MAG: riboflavin synthase [Acidobacteria bacterium]|nr:riboflavin synthase [Acidobacteriota bacterium]MCA1611662.1 riboflavin synthase [Acidobacteriota bacterium]